MTEIQEDKTFAVLKYGLSRYLPIRVVLRKDDTGKLGGLCEESFAMGVYPAQVRIWWSGKAYSFLGEHTLSGINDAEHNSHPGDIICDPLSNDSPIEVDWEKWLAATSKFGKRNAPFKFKETAE